MNLNLKNSDEAQTYPEDIRDKAVGLAENCAWFSLRTYLWLFLGFVMLCILHVMLLAYLHKALSSFLFIFGLMSLGVFVPRLMVRRLLVTHRDEILRIIHGGFNGPDKDRPAL